MRPLAILVLLRRFGRDQVVAAACGVYGQFDGRRAAFDARPDERVRKLALLGGRRSLTTGRHVLQTERPVGLNDGRADVQLRGRFAVIRFIPPIRILFIIIFIFGVRLSDGRRRVINQRRFLGPVRSPIRFG